MTNEELIKLAEEVEVNKKMQERIIEVQSQLIERNAGFMEQQLEIIKLKEENKNLRHELKRRNIMLGV